jgi:hypothetical protein
MLAAQTLHYLGGEIVRVILRERGKHSVHELPRWRLVDVLRRRDKFDAHADKSLVERGIIQAVTREPVYLVDDQVSDA